MKRLKLFQDFPTTNQAYWVIGVCGFYLLSFGLLLGFKTDQLVLVTLFSCFYFASPVTRKFILGFLIFILFWIIYDSMKIFPNYKFNTVNIGNLYLYEKKLFGLTINGERITLNEYFNLHKTLVLDFLSGLFYLCWVPVPLIFAFYLFKKNPAQFLNFSLSFLLVNIIGFTFYYIFPAAPPWYVQEHGFHFLPHTPGNAAGLLRFDRITGLNIFSNMYQKNSNIFAAFPSLHASYPVIVLFFGLKNKMGWVNILFILLVLGIWFGAIYSNHHYLIDIIAGFSCALAGLFLYNKILVNKGWFRSFLTMYERGIKLNP